MTLKYREEGRGEPILQVKEIHFWKTNLNALYSSLDRLRRTFECNATFRHIAQNINNLVNFEDKLRI